MRGLTVVGCGIDSGEVEVALALYDALPGARVFVTAELGGTADDRDGRSFRAAAAPVIAAEHAGARLDPAALVATARDGEDPLIAVAPGGLMASITARYTNRDFARELGLPLVIAARGTGGVTNQVRLVGEAARVAGLAVAAVVLTGWPDPPNRVQLDERALLTKKARVPVMTLPERPGAGAVTGWPVADWFDAEGPPAAAPDEPPVAATAAPPVTLDPYDAWHPRHA